MKKMNIGILLLLLCILFPKSAQAMDVEAQTMMDNQLQLIDVNDFNRELTQIRSETDNPLIEDFDLLTMAKKVIIGEIQMNLSEILLYIVRSIFSEVLLQMALIQKIIMVGILSGLLKNLDLSFMGKNVGEMGFYACFIVMVTILLAAFKVTGEYVQNTVGHMVDIMQAFLPVLATLTVTSGNVAQAATVNPLVMAAAQLISIVIRDFVLPVTTLVAVLQIVNFISAKEVLDKLAELFQSCIQWVLRGVAVVFMSVMAVKNVGAPALNTVVNKTAKVAVGAIPVVGDVLTGAVDTVMVWSNLVKNGVVIGAILFIVLLCAIPVIKIIAMMFIYKFTAALMQPICEERIVKCIDSIGNFSSIMLSCLFVTAIMFIFSMMMLFSSVGG